MDAAFAAILSEPDVMFLCTLKEEQRPTLKAVLGPFITDWLWKESFETLRHIAAHRRASSVAPHTPNIFYGLFNQMDM